MSVRHARGERVWYVYCDRCRAKGTIEAMDADEARFVAKLEGDWSSDGRRDFCNICSEPAAPPTPPV